jgi:hypothetical protein
VNDYQLREPPPQGAPSLYSPIAATAFAAAIVFSMPSFVGASGVDMCCAQNLCGAVFGSLLGILPLLMFRRRGGVVGPGVGFVVCLLGVFIGGIVGAIVQAQFPPNTNEELTAFAGESVDRTLAEFAGLSIEGAFLNKKHTYSYGAHAAHVTVDPQLGHVQIVDYVVVQDVGRAVNPLTLRGQVIGSLVQGLGGAMLEHLQYDAEGQFLTGSLADYLLPTATDFPNVRCIVTEDHPSPINPLGAKGAGEGGIIAAGGAMANAVANALQSFGAQPRQLPLTPAYIWELVQAGQRQAAE